MYMLRDNPELQRNAFQKVRDLLEKAESCDSSRVANFAKKIAWFLPYVPKTERKLGTTFLHSVVFPLWLVFSWLVAFGLVSLEV